MKYVVALITSVALLASGFASAQTASRPPTPRIGLINVLVIDLDRSERFYREVFSLAAPRAYNATERVFALADPNGPRLELVLTEAPRGNSGFSMLVDDVDAVVRRVPGAGGAIVRHPGPLASYRMAIITDPDGSVIEVLQPSGQ